MFKNKTIKINFKELFLIFSFIYIISFINNPFVGIDFSSISKTINTLRGLGPYLLMPILIIYLFLFEKNLNNEWIYFLFFIYLIGQFLGYLINPYGLSHHINNQNQFYWLICNFTTFLYFYSIRDKKYLNIFILKIFIFIISIIAIKFLFDVYEDFYKFVIIEKKVVNFFYNLNSMAPSRLVLEQPVPRSSGLSRMSVIVFLFLYIQLFFVKSNRYKTLVLLIMLGFLPFQFLIFKTE